MEGVPLDEFNLLYNEVVEDSEEEITIISSDVSQIRKSTPNECDINSQRNSSIKDKVTHEPIMIIIEDSNDNISVTKSYDFDIDHQKHSTSQTTVNKPLIINESKLVHSNINTYDSSSSKSSTSSESDKVSAKVKIRPVNFRIQKKGNLSDILSKMGTTDVKIGLNKRLKIESLHKRRKL